MALVTVAEFRAWSGAATGSVSDAVIEACLEEAEAGLVADTQLTIGAIVVNPDAAALAYGEELRRGSRLLARRNSPEAISGMGDAIFTIPVRDPDSARTVLEIQALLNVPIVVA